MSSPSESEDENMAALRSIAKSADAVIETQKADAMTSRRKKRKERGEGDDAGDVPLDGLQLKLRKILEGRLERSLGESIYSGDADGEKSEKTKRKKEKKKSKSKEKNCSNGDLGGGTGNGSVASEGDVRMFRRVAKGAPSILETQGSIREKAEDVGSKTSGRKLKKRKVKGELSEAAEKELRKRSLGVLAVDTAHILKSAEAAKEKAKGKIVDVEEFSGDERQPNGTKKKKKKKKKKKSAAVEGGENQKMVEG
ncbi:hypothetical protein BSKO_09260 [Bryopsis sp. KO-2023]|nr:hypothetical protein BSKO_09260 [Bryopsis sp. KO-2023]